MAGRLCIAAMITLAMLLCSCCVRLDCEPTGRILWSGTVPTSVYHVTDAVDGAMAGLSCDYEIEK
jgi:hypothetical protein